MRILFIFLILFIGGCRQTVEKTVEISPEEIAVKLSVEDTSIIFQKDFDVFVSIENKSNGTIEIDTSPDEVIEPPSETSGGSYKPKGSSFFISVSQDTNKDGQADFNCGSFEKISSQNNSKNSFSIPKGKVYKMKFALRPWGPVISSLPSYASVGPADIEASLILIVNGKSMNIEAEPIKVNFVQRETDKNGREFIGYDGSQPELQVTTSSGSADMEEIEPVIQAAKEFFSSAVQDTNDYWPEPESVSERDNSWWVKFKYKDKKYIINGIESTQSRAPGVLCIDVDKETLNCSIVRNR